MAGSELHKSHQRAAALHLDMPGTSFQRKMKYLMAYEGPELVQINDGLVVVVLSDVEMPHSNLQHEGRVIPPQRTYQTEKECTISTGILLSE